MELEQWISVNTFGEQFVYLRQKHIPFFNVIFCGVTLPNPDYDISWENGTPCYIFDCITSGKCIIGFDGKEQTASAGDVIFFDRHVDSRLRADPDEPCEKTWIQLSGTLMKSLTETYGMRGRVIIKRIDAYPIFEDIKKILTASDISTASEDMRLISAKIMELISVFMRDETFGIVDYGDSPASRVKRMLEQSLYRVVSLDDISRELGLSAPHIVRCYKAAYGITPMKYLAGLRIDTAKLMLSDMIIPVGKIAEKLCFSDSRHFSTVFRNAVGISPSEYRENKRRTK